MKMVKEEVQKAMTRLSSIEVMKHLTTVVQDCGEKVKKSFQYEGISTIVDFINLKESEINDMEYEDVKAGEAGPAISLPKREKRKLKQLHTFVKYHYLKNMDQDWMAFTAEDF